MGRNSGLKHLVAKYDKNKAAKVGEMIVCPVCGNQFKKIQWQQAFDLPQCKDKYHNTIKPNRHKAGNAYYRQYNIEHGQTFAQRFGNGYITRNKMSFSCIEDWDESDEWDNDLDGLRDEDFGYYPGEGD